MNLNEAQTLARTAMRAHGLYGWTFSFNRSKSTFGMCYHQRREIQLSTLLTQHADKAQVMQTIGHEIAHVLVGPGHGHGPVWQRKMRELGLRVERCSVNSDETMQKIAQSRKYTLHCPENDSLVGSRERKGKRTYVCNCHRKPVVWKG